MSSKAITYKCNGCGFEIPFSADLDPSELSCPICDCEDLTPLKSNEPIDDGIYFFIIL